MSAETFKDMGLNFPLYDAPVTSSRDYVGRRDCSLCGREGPCFSSGIGVEIDVPCRHCGAITIALGDEVAEGRRRCRACDAVLALPFTDTDDPCACHDCLRAGRATFTKDTEFGLIDREAVARGMTHGVPGLRTAMFETIKIDEGEWRSAVIPSSHLDALIRTPGYESWQGDIWLFCCKRPMIFIGEWTEADFRSRAVDENAVDAATRMSHPEEARYWEGVFPAHLSFYVFRCDACGANRAHSDCT